MAKLGSGPEPPGGEDRQGPEVQTNVVCPCPPPHCSLFPWVNVGVLPLPPGQWWVSGGASWCLGGGEDEVFLTV